MCCESGCATWPRRTHTTDHERAYKLVPRSSQLPLKRYAVDQCVAYENIHGSAREILNGVYTLRFVKSLSIGRGSMAKSTACHVRQATDLFIFLCLYRCVATYWASQFRPYFRAIFDTSLFGSRQINPQVYRFALLGPESTERRAL